MYPLLLLFVLKWLFWLTTPVYYELIYHWKVRCWQLYVRCSSYLMRAVSVYYPTFPVLPDLNSLVNSIDVMDIVFDLTFCGCISVMMIWHILEFTSTQWCSCSTSPMLYHNKDFLPSPQILHIISWCTEQDVGNVLGPYIWHQNNLQLG